MDPTERKRLSDEWLRNEAELERLKDLPVGQSDPAQRQRELDQRQDEIEYELGKADLNARRKSET